MKILFDHQCFSMQNYGGVSRYFAELIRGFAKEPDIDMYVSTEFTNNSYLANKSFLPNNEFKGKKLILHEINKLFSKHQIKKNKFDLFHPTYYNPYFINSLKKPFVLTVFDMIHEIFPDHVHRLDKTAEYKKLLVTKATKIIAISHNTKKDLVNILKVPPEKVEVIHLASCITKDMANLKYFDNLPERSVKRYILYVGGRNYYKNFDNLLLAFEELVKHDDTLYLICAGGGRFNGIEQAIFEKKGLTNNIISYPADDKTLATLYSNALVFVFPSLYEGFGLPVLEAMSCDCPVALSNRGSLSEIASKSAIFFDPKDPINIQTMISKVIYNSELRNRFIKKGRLKCEKFSWEETVKKTKGLYQNIGV